VQNLLHARITCSCTREKNKRNTCNRINYNLFSGGNLRPIWQKEISITNVTRTKLKIKYFIQINYKRTIVKYQYFEFIIKNKQGYTDMKTVTLP